MKLKVKSVDVFFLFNTAPAPLRAEHVVTCSPEEAFAIMTMPAFSGLVTKMVPNYSISSSDELSEMPKE